MILQRAAAYLKAISREPEVYPLLVMTTGTLLWGVYCLFRKASHSFANADQSAFTGEPLHRELAKSVLESTPPARKESKTVHVGKRPNEPA